MRNIEDIIRLVCVYLNEHELEYVIVGGVAVIAYGTPRTTMDIDLVIRMEKDEMVKLAEYLQANDFFSDPRDIVDAFEEHSHFSAMDNQSLLRLDIKGVYNEQDQRTLKNRRKLNYHSMELYLASPEDTIAHKLLFNSDQDIRDAEAIFIRQFPNLDLEELITICAQMDVAQELEKLRQRVREYVEDDQSV